ncbi:MAG: hypothetical protein R3B92_00320 [Patescibacteria group bacterium]
MTLLQTQQKNNLRYFYISRIFYELYFWGVVAIPFYIYKGFTIDYAFWLIAIYSYLVIVLEFPTGIIGDHYGHKISVALAGIFNALGFIILLYASHIVGFILAVIALALGLTLNSGSDIALLKKISKDFKKDLKESQYVRYLTLTLAFAISGIIGSLKLEYTLYLSIITNLLSTIFTLLVKEETKYIVKEKLIQTITQSINTIKTIKNGMLIIILMSVTGGLGGVAKTIIGSFEEILNINLQIVGLLIAISMGARTVGLYLEKFEFFTVKQWLLILATLYLLATSIVISKYIGITFYLITLAVVELIYFKVKLALSTEVKHTELASVLSLTGLTRKAVVGTILNAIGLASGIFAIQAFFVGTGLTIGVFAITQYRKIRSIESTATVYAKQVML